MKRFELREAPANQTGPVKAWSEPVVIPTYRPMPADKNPMFFEKRVYQGSSGRVYPLPFTDRITGKAVEHLWQALHLENEFIRLMVLPEIGGRIHVGVDKCNGYDFFYRQNVIKPALVGLAGPWISGGVEFNWPQHHRPATFMPVNCQIQEDADGSRTIWCSDHDPMNRLKGMHGVCLHPGKAFIELKVRLYNRTAFSQTFLWWANVGVHVHELYQSFFPPDVQYVADHAKRAVSRFPLCEGGYYGINYDERAKHGVPAVERPRKFTPRPNLRPNDLSWYANIPVPTSYMALGSQEDFFGGYDHKCEAGVVHFANRHISPGKKQWTWGNHEFGYAWERNLTDEDGPYIELMAGVFTDNQPDFSFLAPGETKSFSQYWYPIREIGPPQRATLDAAVSLSKSNGNIRVGVYVTQSFLQASVRLEAAKQPFVAWTRDLTPASPLVETARLPSETLQADLVLVVETREGKELIRYASTSPGDRVSPAPATEPPWPGNTSSGDELYFIGAHLEQYRHATRSAGAYWREGLRRDPGDSRCNNALGLFHLRRGEFEQAEGYFRRGIERLTKWNPNPYDGEPYYNLALTLRYLGRDDEAYDAFYKAAWSQPWISAAHLALGELDAKRRDWSTAIEHLRASLQVNAGNLNARNLAVVVLRQLGRQEESDRLLRETLALDPMDSWARYLAGSLPFDNQMLFDLALDYARGGLYSQAVEVLSRADRNARDGSLPVILYAVAYFHQQLGDAAAARTASSQAREAPPDYCFPSRLEELLILQAAVSANREDARAPYYLGNLLYDRRRHREAIALWEQSARLDSRFSTVWRNLGIGYFNVLRNTELARCAFDEALRADTADARVLYERDQLWKATGELPVRRLAELEKFPHLVGQRDDLSVELATLYNQAGQPEKALALIQSHRFQPWEGGEGLVLGQHVRALLALGQRALAAGDPAKALKFFEAALDCPENLGEARHFLANQSDVYYWLGIAFDAMGDAPSARLWLERAAKDTSDFRQMTVRSFSEMTYYNALALKRLDRAEEAEKVLRSLLAYAQGLRQQEAELDYFATSLPAMLLFEDDLVKRNRITATFLHAQASLGLADRTKAQELITQVLELDPNHPFAADLLAELKRNSVAKLP